LLLKKKMSGQERTTRIHSRKPSAPVIDDMRLLRSQMIAFERTLNGIEACLKPSDPSEQQPESKSRSWFAAAASATARTVSILFAVGNRRSLALSGNMTSKESGRLCKYITGPTNALPSCFLSEDIGSALKAGLNVCQRQLVNEMLGLLVTEFVRNFGREGATPNQRGFNALTGSLSFFPSLSFFFKKAFAYVHGAWPDKYFRFLYSTWPMKLWRGVFHKT
jgi:hypothetical protein